MSKLVRTLGQDKWSLLRAREMAVEIGDRKSAVKALVAAMFEESPELRQRAADVARRITDGDASMLYPYAEELTGLLAEISPAEWRTRYHLGLVVARTAHTQEQRLRAGRLMELLMQDESNVVRCSAIEGMSLLACEERRLHGTAVESIATALRSGTPAMKARARHAKRRLRKALKHMEDLG